MVPWDHVPKVTEIVVISDAVSTPLSLSLSLSLSLESLCKGQSLKGGNGSHTYGQSVNHISTDVVHSHPLHRTCFDQYQASSAAPVTNRGMGTAMHI